MSADPARVLEKQAKLILEVTRTSARRELGDESPDQEPPRDVEELAWLGFPGVYTTAFHPDVDACAELKRHARLPFPGLCCVCARPSDLLLPSAQMTPGWRSRVESGPLARCVPHCAEHGAREHARLILTVLAPDPAKVCVHLAGLSREFLVQTRALNLRGDRFPPWHVFPLLAPESGGWRQGTGEIWMQRSWRPFWSALTPAERRAYLTRWTPPPEWAEWLATELD